MAPQLSVASRQLERMNRTPPPARYGRAGIVVGLLLAGGLVALWLAGRGGNLDPADHVWMVPPGVELETYPRLTAWELRSITDVNGTTVLKLSALSGACNLSQETAEQVTETFDRVEVRQTAETVTIETWLGPPEGEGFWPGCQGTAWGFAVEVRLDSPLGDRELVDPACALDRYRRFVACEQSKLAGIG